MNDKTVILFLVCAVAVLLCMIFWQRFAYSKGIQADLGKISAKLSEILINDSEEKLMVFTDNQALMDVCGQVNCLLLDRQRIKADFKRQEISSGKMLSNISHDIKTPLTVILGYLEMLRLKQENIDALEKVEKKALQLMELVDSFFVLTKLEAGDAPIERSTVNISELCRENILDFYEILTQKGFEVEVSLPEKELFVKGDIKALERILSNLLSNGVRYGSSGKYLGLGLREEEDFIYIDVTDKGRGIPREAAAHIFDRLYTLEDSRSREIQGNGLGLAIARNLARQMGGDIFLESEQDQGATFTVKLCKAGL